MQKLQSIRDRLNRMYVRHVRWTGDKGDQTHRLNYDLNKNAIVFDLGGFEGQWASDIFDRFHCTVYVFEPVADYAEHIRKRFTDNPKIHVYPFGLAAENTEAAIAISGNASSLFTKPDPNAATETIKLWQALNFFKQERIEHIDLMKINIEGGEYDLLDHLIDSGWVTNIDNIQVQFHDFYPNAESRMKRIQAALLKTHGLTYQYVFTWENWRKKA